MRGGGTGALDYLTELAGLATDYNPFNLLVFDGTSLLGLESRHAKVTAMHPGVGAVSNADFLTPWPKLSNLKGGLQTLQGQEPPSDAQLLALLQNPCVAADADLPDTGIPLEFERALSAAFIALPDYGTRACSIVRFEADQIVFLEQGFDANGSTGTRQFTTTRRHVQGDSPEKL